MYQNPLCPICAGTFEHMRSAIRWKKYITVRYFHHGGTVCRGVYMVPSDYKKLKRLRKPRVKV